MSHSCTMLEFCLGLLVSPITFIKIYLECCTVFKDLVLILRVIKLPGELLILSPAFKKLVSGSAWGPQDSAPAYQTCAPYRSHLDQPQSSECSHIHTVYNGSCQMRGQLVLLAQIPQA